MILSSQPVGIFSGAAAHLLLPIPQTQPTPSSDAPVSQDSHWNVALQALMQGNLGIEVPPAWQFFVAAANGQIERANHLLDEHHHALGGDELQEQDRALLPQWVAYCRYVLNPTERPWSTVLTKLTDPKLRSLLHVVAFAYGLDDQAPAVAGLEGELLAWALATGAAKSMEQENYLAARQSLTLAVEAARGTSPILAAILISQSVQIAELCHVPGELMVAELQDALNLADDCKLPDFLGELHMQKGMLLQRVAADDRSKLLSAVRSYQAALQSGINGQSHPAMFAELQNNLGLCYLAMPQTESSAQLRTGIAIQSFKHGLSSIDPRTHNELWARINMNLANALQYAPTSHPVENLVQAVETYEQVLQVRTRARDPVAYALTILNQANALAHLGMFKPALEKASEAYKLFQWYDQAEAAVTARELVENINNHLTDSRSGDREPQPESSSASSSEQVEPQHGSVPATTI